MKAHTAAQEDVFKKIFETVQAKQMKEMEAFFGRWNSTKGCVISMCDNDLINIKST